MVGIDGDVVEGGRGGGRDKGVEGDGTAVRESGDKLLDVWC